MANRCCLYETNNGENRTLCTTDANCPNITGWTLIGQWSVDSCANCSVEGGGDEEVELVTTAIESELLKKLKEFEKALIIMHWIREHWGEVFPDAPPIEKIEKLKDL